MQSIYIMGKLMITDCKHTRTTILACSWKPKLINLCSIQNWTISRHFLIQCNYVIFKDFLSNNSFWGKSKKKEKRINKIKTTQTRARFLFVGQIGRAQYWCPSWSSYAGKSSKPVPCTESAFLDLLLGIYGIYNTPISTPDQYRYRFLTEYGIPSPNRTAITFKVRACNDAHVTLRPSDREPLEIVLGGWANSRSCLRTEIQGPCLSEYVGDILDCDDFRTFNVYWGNGRIKVGKSTSFCDAREVILDLRVNNSLPDVEIGISTGYGASGEWIFGGLNSFISNVISKYIYFT